MILYYSMMFEILQYFLNKSGGLRINYFFQNQLTLCPKKRTFNLCEILLVWIDTYGYGLMGMNKLVWKCFKWIGSIIFLPNFYSFTMVYASCGRSSNCKYYIIIKFLISKIF